MNEPQTMDPSETPDNIANTLQLFDVVGIIVVSVFIVLVGSFTLFKLSNIAFGNPENINEPSLTLNAGLAALEGVALISSVYLFGIRRRQMSWEDFGLKPTTSKWIIRAAFVALLFIPIIATVALLIQLLLGLPIENPQLEFLLPDKFSWTGALGMLILGGLVVPFAEELFFRGVLYQWMRYKAGIWIGIIGSSLVFGLLHGEPSVAGATFVMGILLAWIFEQSNSLWPSVAIHVVNNSIKIALLYALTAFGISIPGF